MSPLRILHLVGSPTSQFYCELSELYATGCIQALAQPKRYTFLIAYVTPDQHWRFPASLQPADVAAAKPVSFAEAVRFLSQQNIDVALPQMFCRAGMCEYRALLDLLKIPFVGNQSFQMALTADKAKVKAVIGAAGVNVPKGELLRRGEQPSIVPPAVVKPNNSDNSDGVGFVRTAADYAAALATAFAYDDQVIVEEFVELGREVRCGIVVQGGELVCLPLEEYFVDAELRPVRSRVHKIRRDQQNALTLAAKEKTQAWIVDEKDSIVPGVWAAARKCHQAIGCRHYSLFDFRIDPQGRPWFIEAGLYCSFSPQSVVVMMMEAKGVALKDFFDMAIRQAMHRPSSEDAIVDEPIADQLAASAYSILLTK